MNRRDFILKTLAAGVAVSGISKITKAGKNLGFGKPPQVPNGNSYDLIAVKGGNPVEMYDLAIEAAGGMKTYVKPGQTVLVKPNIGWDKVPKMGANTNPELVKRVIETCFEAGASKVSVFDHTCDEWRSCYKNSGIEDAISSTGANLVPGNSERMYQNPIEIKDGVILKNARIHDLIVNSDVFINVPILKHHGGGKLSISLKNLMGVMWDRGKWHKDGLHQCIADFATSCKPTLNIVDAYRVMTQNGPKGVSEDDTVLMKALLLSTDMVAADAAAAKMMKVNPENVEYIVLADKAGVGTMDLEKLKIKRIKI